MGLLLRVIAGREAKIPGVGDRRGWEPRRQMASPTRPRTGRTGAAKVGRRGREGQEKNGDRHRGRPAVRTERRGSGPANRIDPGAGRLFPKMVPQSLGLLFGRTATLALPGIRRTMAG